MTETVRTNPKFLLGPRPSTARRQGATRRRGR
jgi:hypothetical protein